MVKNSPAGIKSWIGNTSITPDFFHARRSQISATCSAVAARFFLTVVGEQAYESVYLRPVPDTVKRDRSVIHRWSSGEFWWGSSPDLIPLTWLNPPVSAETICVSARLSSAEDRYISFISRAITKHVWKSFPKFDLEIPALAPIILPRDSRQFRTSCIYFLPFFFFPWRDADFKLLFPTV